MEWSKKQTLELVELVHVHECLWNVKNKNYKDRHKKKDSVEAIARKMGISHSDIEKKIINLKTQYNREVNKIKTKSECGTDDEYASTWYAFKPLSFLKNNYLPKNSTTTDSTTEGITRFCDREESYLNTTDREENFDETVNSNDSIKSEEQYIMPSTSRVSEISAISEEIKLPAKRFKPDRQTEALSMLKEARDNIISHKLKDEFDIFGEYMASELRGIVGKKDILEIKKQIHDLIFYKKLEQLKSDSTTRENGYEDSN